MNIIIGLILLCICAEPLVFKALLHNLAILQVFFGTFVILLVISFAMCKSSTEITGYVKKRPTCRKKLRCSDWPTKPHSATKTSWMRR